MGVGEPCLCFFFSLFLSLSPSLSPSFSFTLSFPLRPSPLSSSSPSSALDFLSFFIFIFISIFRHHHHHHYHRFFLTLSLLFSFSLLGTCFINFHVFSWIFVHVITQVAQKLQKKKRLIKKRFLIFRHFGRFSSPKSDLSDGQAGANCETSWRVKSMFTQRHIMPMKLFLLK